MDKALYICDCCSEDCFEIYNMIEKGLCVWKRTLRLKKTSEILV
jgi:hypothetical protein